MRSDELRRVRMIAATRQPSQGDIGREYRVVRGHLREMQSYKCCYCEKSIEEKYQDVEHYRPKTTARRSSGVEVGGYWWLAWSWDNLLFACDHCDRSHKRTWFPLVGDELPHDGNPLMPEQQPPGQEKPLLLNPADPTPDDDPLMHIQFRPVVTNDEQQWRPFCRRGSPRGYETIEKLKLDRDELLDLYRAHVEMMQPALNKLTEALEDTDQTAVEVRRAWSDLCQQFVQPERPFSALARDVADYHCPRGLRDQYQLAFPPSRLHVNEAEGLARLAVRSA